jgi:hypothetical protein
MYCSLSIGIPAGLQAVQVEGSSLEPKREASLCEAERELMFKCARWTKERVVCKHTCFTTWKLTNFSETVFDHISFDARVSSLTQWKNFGRNWLKWPWIEIFQLGLHQIWFNTFTEFHCNLKGTVSSNKTYFIPQSVQSYSPKRNVHHINFCYWLLTNSAEQCSIWKTDSFSAVHKVYGIFWTEAVCCGVHSNSSLVAIKSQWTTRRPSKQLVPCSHKKSVDYTQASKQLVRCSHKESVDYTQAIQATRPL